MGEKLHLDLAAIQQVQDDLLQASIMFGSIDHDSRTAADAVGHDDLAGRVRDFSTTWDDRRTSIMESVDALWKAVNAVHDGFVNADTALGRRVKGQG